LFSFYLKPSPFRW